MRYHPRAEGRKRRLRDRPFATSAPRLLYSRGRFALLRPADGRQWDSVVIRHRIMDMETQDSPLAAHPQPRRRLRWVGAFLCLGLLAGGLGAYIHRLSTAPPAPPDPEVSANEPALA